MSAALHRDDDAPPAGFARFSIGPANVVCAAHVAGAMREILRNGTLYDYAAAHPRARALAGRGVVYAASLPGDVERVVVRHNHHGGLLARFTRDLFPIPTRAPRELRTSERLRASLVPTPIILGYVLYDVLPGLCRADVMSREVENAFDLSVAMMSADSELRARALAAAADLVRAVIDAGAWHKDLNVKNVLLHPASPGGLDAMILDVDRVKFPGANVNVRELNLARLLRSARKWQSTYGAPVTAAELDELASLIREPSPRRATTAS
jgi:lipopolysaccharide kinase (Kdo/WaaP) family protein